MSPRETVTKCAEAEGIIARHEAGEKGTSDQERLWAEHLEECRDCADERAALALLSIDSLPAGPGRELDEIARRRLVDAIVDRALEPTQSAASPTGPRAERRSGKMTLTFAALALAACALLGVGIAVLQRGARATGVRREPLAQPAPSSTANPAIAGQPIASTTLLCAGEVSIDGAAADIERALRPGARLRTSQGRAAVAVGPRAVLAVLADTEIGIGGQGDEAAIQLERGSVLASVDPVRPGPGLRIDTRLGAVRVKGTVFSVTDQREGVTVRVFRGRVEITGPFGPTALEAGSAITIGAGGPRSLERAEREGAAEDTALLSMLAARGTSRVRIDSVPSAASLSIDGIKAGWTPLVAALRPSSRKLVLSLAGRDEVALELQIASRGDVRRTVEMPVSTARLPRGSDAARLSGKVEALQGEVAPVAPSLAGLLKRAQALRREKEWAEAAAAYMEVVRQFEGTPEALASRVSAASLYLNKLGSPEWALAEYERYLVDMPQGPLAQEALMGKARALRALHRVLEEREALETFLRRFKDALEARAARERLAEIDGGNRP